MSGNGPAVESSLRSRAHHLVLDDHGAGRSFDLIIQALIVLSLVTFAIETLPGLTPSTLSVLRALEIITVLVFTAEYLLRAWVARPTRAFVFSFFGLIDLLAILPFYIATGVDLRSVRALRLLRLFRVLKLARYSAAIRRCQIALSLVKEELVLFLCLSGVVLYLAAVGIYYFERAAQPDAFASVFHALWWSLATLTTVGYGDIYPVTAAGKCFTALVLLVGLGIIAVPTGMVASALSEARAAEREGKGAS